MRVAVTLMALVVAACASPARDPMRVDYLGNRYPAACADLSDVNIPIIEARNIYYAPGESAFGEWLPREPTNVILILKGLAEPLRSETIRHEKCHEKMWRLTGNPAWHKAAP